MAPVYNEMIEWGAKIVIYNVGKSGDGMYGLGAPSDLDLFVKLSVSKKIEKHKDVTFRR